jgi:hypothetical protein
MGCMVASHYFIFLCRVPAGSFYTISFACRQTLLWVITYLTVDYSSGYRQKKWFIKNISSK